MFISFQNRNKIHAKRGKMDNAIKLLGKRIRHLRLLHEFTQQELGEKADVSYKYIGAIERGEKNPTVDNIAKIAKALDVELYQLFIFEHEIDDSKILKDRIDDLIDKASLKEVKTVFRVIQAILK